jgi:hypothetical protein
MIIPIVVSVLAISQTPQVQYDEYLKQFDGKTICGTMLAEGGPVSQPSGFTFRVAPGGKFHIFAPSWERHSDGKMAYSYYPKDNSYSENPLGYSDFRILFGPKYFAEGADSCQVAGAAAAKFEEEEVQVFTFLSQHGDKVELLVKRKDSRPIGIRQFGNQSSYLTRLVELRTDQTFSEASWTWKPPAGATKR